MHYWWLRRTREPAFSDRVLLASPNLSCQCWLWSAQCYVQRVRWLLSNGKNMEVYFKNLSSDEVSTEKLVEDLMMLVQDAEQLVKATGANIGEASRTELVSALERVRTRAETIKHRAVAGAQATDRLIRDNPYRSLGVVFAVG